MRAVTVTLSSWVKPPQASVTIRKIARLHPQKVGRDLTSSLHTSGHAAGLARHITPRVPSSQTALDELCRPRGTRTA